MSAVDGPTLEGLKILVVDDDAENCELLTTFFEFYGISVQTAVSVDEAWRVFNLGKPDLLIVDICLPETSGHFLIRLIRETEVNQAQPIPAIALTALATEQDERDSLAAGFQKHITKPVDLDALLAEIVGLLKRQTIEDNSCKTIE